MGARDWLDEVRIAASRIEPLQRELSALLIAHDECLPWVTKGSTMTASMGGTHSDPTASEAMSRMDSLDRRIAETRALLDMCIAIVGECGEILTCMGDELGQRYRDVIECYYIDRASTWSEVANELGIHRDTVRTYRDSAYLWLETHVSA